MQHAQIYLKVTNNNDFPITDGYDGVSYMFMPGTEGKVIPFHVAAHIFGLHSPDDLNDRAKVKDHVCRRWGWNRPDVGTERAQAMFDKIVFDLKVYEMREVEDTSDYLPAPRVDVTSNETDTVDVETNPRRPGRPKKSHDEAA